jgi:hypothetical protein
VDTNLKINNFSNSDIISTATNQTFCVFLITNDSYINAETKKDKVELTSNCKLDKNHKRLGSFNQSKRKATLVKSLQQ